jgi:hypothetical protein
MPRGGLLLARDRFAAGLSRPLAPANGFGSQGQPPCLPLLAQTPCPLALVGFELPDALGAMREEGRPDAFQQAFRRPVAPLRLFESLRRRGGMEDMLDGRLLHSPALRRPGLARGFRLKSLDHLMAGLLLGQLAEVLGANALDAVIGGFEILVGQDNELHILPFLDRLDGASLFVQQEGGHAERQLGEDPLRAVLHRLFFDDAKNRQGQGFDAPDGALAAAAGADQLTGFPERRTQSLPGHFQETKAGDASHLDARPVLLQCLPQPILHLPLIAGGGHVDEVDDEQAPEVSQPKLTGDLIGRL